MGVWGIGMAEYDFNIETVFEGSTLGWIRPVTYKTLRLGPVMADKFEDAVRSFAGMYFRKPTDVKGVIFHDPATILFWEDGTKTVSKCHDGDEFDPLFGILASVVRKVTKNKGHGVDAWEPIIAFLADYLANADECRTLAEVLNLTADAMELDGVAEGMAAYDKRTEEPKQEEKPEELKREEKPEEPKDDAEHTRRVISEVLDDVLEYGATHGYERTRQVIRDLVDRGEL